MRLALFLGLCRGGEKVPTVEPDSRLEAWSAAAFESPLLYPKWAALECPRKALREPPHEPVPARSF